MAELIATGTTDAYSTDITLGVGDVCTLSIKTGGVPMPITEVSVQIKGSDGAYLTVGKIDNATPAVSISSPGVYRVFRRACPIAIGVDKV